MKKKERKKKYYMNTIVNNVTEECLCKRLRLFLTVRSTAGSRPRRERPVPRPHN